MKYFLDTEFTEFGGKLISLALVSEDLKTEWYEVIEETVEMTHNMWVWEHVIPVLGRKPIPLSMFRSKLWSFLRKSNVTEIIADWPEDIAHFCFMMQDKGMCVNLSNIKFSLVSHDRLFPEIPHNALSDARALRDYYVI